jgi:hypothetical protein
MPFLELNEGAIKLLAEGEAAAVAKFSARLIAVERTQVNGLDAIAQLLQRLRGW